MSRETWPVHEHVSRSVVNAVEHAHAVEVGNGCLRQRRLAVAQRLDDGRVIRQCPWTGILRAGYRGGRAGSDALASFTPVCVQLELKV